MICCISCDSPSISMIFCSYCLLVVVFMCHHCDDSMLLSTFHILKCLFFLLMYKAIIRRIGTHVIWFFYFLYVVVFPINSILRCVTNKAQYMYWYLYVFCGLIIVYRLQKISMNLIIGVLVNSQLELKCSTPYPGPHIGYTF